MLPAVALDDLDPHGTTRWGAKASELARWKQQGFTVPEAVVLETGCTAESVGPAIADEATLVLGPGPWAVRSSSVAEDQAEFSSAGKYTSVLNVHPAGLAEAVREVLESAGDAPMAVLIQRMVRAVASGVAFSADPLTGLGGSITVNAVAGLGDRLVGGEVSPDEWVVHNGEAELRLPGHRGEGLAAMGAAGSAFSPRKAVEVANLALELEGLAGYPVDIEWAYEGDALYLLQVRPITTGVTPVPIDIVVPPGTWTRDEGHGLNPRTPLTNSVFSESPAMLAMAKDAGLLMAPATVDIGGWHYSGLVPMGLPTPKSGRPAPPPPPDWLLPVLYRLLPGTRRQLRKSRQAWSADYTGRTILRWQSEFRPQLENRLRVLQYTDLPGVTDAALASQLREARNLIRDGLRIHFQLAAPLMLAIAELHFLLEEELGWPASRTMELLAGTSAMSSEPARKLAELAKLADNDPSFTVAWLEFQRFYGARALETELASPTLAESPALLNRLLEAERVSSFSGADADDSLSKSRETAAATARAALLEAALSSFERLRARALAAYPIREANVFFTVDAPLASYRYAAMEAGRRAAARGLLHVPADVFFCTANELEQSLLEGADNPRTAETVPLKETVRRRRGQRAWALANPGPPQYGPPPPPPPSLKGFPQHVKLATKALVWAGESIVERPLSIRSEPTREGLLTGIPASSGHVEGTARIIRSEADFASIRPGDVLVCPCTRPSWSVIFPFVSAIVTDSGGTLSHPAIIAREHRIPAVVATGCATAVLRNGMALVVDGGAGTVSY